MVWVEYIGAYEEGEEGMPRWHRLYHVSKLSTRVVLVKRSKTSFLKMK